MANIEDSLRNDMREFNRARLHKDVIADAHRLALYPRLVEALKQVVSSRYIVNIDSVLLSSIDDVLHEASKIK